MSRRVIFCEGVDDFAALRGLLKRAFDLEPSGPSKTYGIGLGSSQVIRSTVQFQVTDTTSLHVVVAGNREKAIQRAVDELASGGSPADPVDLVGASFDPDGALETWAKDFKVPAEATEVDLGWWLAGRTLLALPWTAPGPPFDKLPELANLERVAIAVLSEQHPALRGIVEGWLDQIAAARGEAWRTWKAAALLWNAIALHKVSPEAFYDKVFDQDATTREAVHVLLANQRLWPNLKRLASP